MPDYGQPLMFGTFLPPDARNAGAVVELAVLADRTGLDVIGIQDHPYNPRFLDTWTLLAVLAAKTEQIRLFPDVANLPLRPPAMLAKAAASLDLLSGGRVELGLGAGAGVGGPQATLGTPTTTPGEAVAALEEAISVIRTLWQPGAGKAFDGAHYRLRGAAGGPAPAHPMGIWLGAYGPRMLDLTGRLADGWVPSQGYAGPDRMRKMSVVVDDAAHKAGRDPAEVRRVYNVNPDPSPEELTEYALDLGVSVFIVPPGGDPAHDLRRLAEETAPAVRDAVARAREASGVAVRRDHASSDSDPPPLPVRDRVVVSSPLIDEAARPRLGRAPVAGLTPQGRANQEALLEIHDHLRSQLAQLREAVEQVLAGGTDLARARDLVNKLSLEQNLWAVGAFCVEYCRFVELHHRIEDRRMFPEMIRQDAAVEPVVEQLMAEHRTIHGLLADLDEKLVGILTDREGLRDVREALELVAGTLLSHLAYEEDELASALAMLPSAV